MHNNDQNLVEISGKLLLNVKLNDNSENELLILKGTSFAVLNNQLNTDTEKNVFWINIYNAYFQILSKQNNNLGKRIFNKKLVEIAETKFSLDDIEHGILRRFRWKYSLGYLPNVFASAKIRNLAVDTIDHRIHFALNCGAKSCPPIAFYKIENLNIQLDQATFSFLSSETTIDEDKKSVMTSKILFWFIGDFCGVLGVKKTLEKVLGKDFSNYKLSYKNYNWESQLYHFAE